MTEKLGSDDEVAGKIDADELAADDDPNVKADGTDVLATDDDDPNVKVGVEFAVLDKEKGLAVCVEADAPNANSCPADEVPDWPANDGVVGAPADCTVKVEDGDDIELTPNEKVGMGDTDETADEGPKEKAGVDDGMLNVSGSSAIGSVAMVSPSASLSEPGPSVAMVAPFSTSNRSTIAAGDAGEGSDSPASTNAAEASETIEDSNPPVAAA